MLYPHVHLCMYICTCYGIGTLYKEDHEAFFFLSENLWPCLVIHILSPSIFLKILRLCLSLKPNSIPFYIHTSFSLCVICWWAARWENILGRRKPSSRWSWASTVWSHWWSYTAGAWCGCLQSGERRPEAHFTLRLHPASIWRVLNIFRKEVI